VKRTVLTVASALLLAGCGSSSRQSNPTTQQSVPSATTTVSTGSTQQVGTKHHTRETLRAEVRAALLANHHLAIQVLWTNRVPASALHSTRGPALAEMAASAKNRERKGIRVRMLHDVYRVLSIRLGATKMTATAFAEWDQRVVPSHPNGTPFGRAVLLRERARIELRRVDTPRSFVVWKVTLVK
jgi:uncharacterized protein YceK